MQGVEGADILEPEVSPEVDQRPRFLVLTKRSAACGDENVSGQPAQASGKTHCSNSSFKDCDAADNQVQCVSYEMAQIGNNIIVFGARESP